MKYVGMKKDHIKMVGSFVVKIVLVAIYVYVFGQHSVTKFFKKGVIIVNDEIPTSSVLPPGLDICALLQYMPLLMV